MAEIRFYHLTRLPVEQAMPELLEKCLQRNWRVVVQLQDGKAAEKLTQDLWTGHPDSFLPHGNVKDGKAEEQPIWVTAQEENPNSAQVLFLINGATHNALTGFDLICEVFDGSNSEQVETARTRWKAYKKQGLNLTYWQQTENGWEKKG